jgi:hypothetical protein
MASPQNIYQVVIKGNLVCAIQPVSMQDTPLRSGTPLEVGTQLATNFTSSGSIDGVYAFQTTSQAQEFAVLCLQFGKALLERRLKAIEGLPPNFKGYFSDEQPTQDAAN